MGSLGSDLSPLGPLYSSYGQNCFHCIVHVEAGGALLATLLGRTILEKTTFSLPKCFQVSSVAGRLPLCVPVCFPCGGWSGQVKPAVQALWATQGFVKCKESERLKFTGFSFTCEVFSLLFIQPNSSTSGCSLLASVTRHWLALTLLHCTGQRKLGTVLHRTHKKKEH